MRKASPLMFIVLLALCTVVFYGQRKSSKSANGKALSKGMKSLVKPFPPKKVEIEDWQEFVFSENDFKIRFPKKPESFNHDENEGDTPIKIYTYQTDINDLFFLVNIAQYPKGFLPKRKDLGVNLGEWLKEIILDGPNILGERLIDWDEHTGVEFVYKQGGDEITIHRAFVVDQRLYQLMIHLKSKKGETLPQTVRRNKKQVDEFFDSFSLTVKSDGIEDAD